MALYGYARVSTSDQDLTLQTQTLRAAGCEIIRAEKASGSSRTGRSELQLLLEFLRPGDTLMVTRVDRLARSIKDLQDKGKPEDILTTEAVDLLAMKLRTPLQVQLHLTLAMEAGYQTGEKPITATLVESVLSRQLDDLEPTLTRHGYRLKDMVEQFDAKPAEIRALFNNQLDPARTAELRDRMLAVGLPI